MARVSAVLSVFLVVAVIGSNAFPWPWNSTTTTPRGDVLPWPWKATTTAAPEDDSIVYHDRSENIDGQEHVTIILNNDSDDLEDEARLGVYRVIMDVVMKKAIPQLQEQSSDDSQITTNDIDTNELESQDPPSNDATTTSTTTSTTENPTSTSKPHPHPHPRPHPHPHPRRCRTCECWDRCKHTRKYNWGICLCGKCHCYR